MANILVVGGAGYIGSHMVLQLLAEDHKVIVLDDLSTGQRAAIPDQCEFVLGSLADSGVLQQLFTQHAIDAVMHFAAFIQVGESVTAPSKYYRNNFSHTLTLLDTMLAHGVNKFIFSSTAAIFGEPQYVPIDNAHPKAPINPYGRSKWMVEQALEDYDIAYGLKAVALRYFNAAGADPLGRVGECHEPETHLIPLILQVAAQRREHIAVFGRDYPTHDGTAVRDYIHVVDLCQAHSLALQHLLKGGDSRRYNLGNGLGFSVQEVIDTVRTVTLKDIKVIDQPRRAGDPARLIADARAIQQELNWTPIYPSLNDIVAHAWGWELKWGRQQS